MSLQQLNIGQAANDGTGDQLRTAFNTINENAAKTATIHRMLYNENLPLGFLPDSLIISTGELSINTFVNSLDIIIPDNYFLFNAIFYAIYSETVISECQVFLNNSMFRFFPSDIEQGCIIDASPQNSETLTYKSSENVISIKTFCTTSDIWKVNLYLYKA